MESLARSSGFISAQQLAQMDQARDTDTEISRQWLNSELKRLRQIVKDGAALQYANAAGVILELRTEQDYVHWVRERYPASDVCADLPPETGRRLYYWPEDTYHDLMKEGMIYLQLRNGGILGVLIQMEQNGRNYRKFLAQYPHTMCEPLERYYRCRNACAKLNEHMLQDMLFCHGWREANWVAWLAALAPHPSYRPHLERRRPTLPHGVKVIDLALAACGAECPEDLHQHFTLLTSIQEMLAELPPLRLPLRPYLSLEQDQQYSMEVESLRQTLRTEGAAAFKHQIKLGLYGYYGQSYQEWLNMGAPLPPPAHIPAAPANIPLIPESNSAAPEKTRPWWRFWA